MKYDTDKLRKVAAYGCASCGVEGKLPNWASKRWTLREPAWPMRFCRVGTPLASHRYGQIPQKAWLNSTKMAG